MTSAAKNCARCRHVGPKSLGGVRCFRHVVIATNLVSGAMERRGATPTCESERRPLGAIDRIMGTGTRCGEEGRFFAEGSSPWSGN